MGYRSAVRVITTKIGFEQIKKYIEKELSKEEKKGLWNVLNEINLIKETDNFVLFGWDWVKYYGESYKLFQESLNELEELDISYSVTINNETMGDVEEYRYESESEKYAILPMPSISCSFNDEDTMQMLKQEETFLLQREINQLKEKIATYEMNNNEMECEM